MIRWTVEARAVNDEGEPTTFWHTLISYQLQRLEWLEHQLVNRQCRDHSNLTQRSEGGCYSSSNGPSPMAASTLTEEYQMVNCANQDYESGICYSYCT